MEINTNNQRATLSQKMVLEMLLADVPETGHKWVSDDKKHPHGELSLWAKKLGVEPRSELKAIRRETIEQDVSHPAMFVDLSSCIQCDRCVRACREEQANDVIGVFGRGQKQKLFLILMYQWEKAHAWLVGSAFRRVLLAL